MRIDSNHCRPGNRKSPIGHHPPNDLDRIFKKIIRLIKENVKLPDCLQMSEDMAKNIGVALYWRIVEYAGYLYAVRFILSVIVCPCSDNSIHRWTFLCVVKQKKNSSYYKRMWLAQNSVLPISVFYYFPSSDDCR
jgi:hypothetical protein